VDNAVDAYIASFPPEVQAKLEAMRAVVIELAPEATQGIAYGMPAFKLRGRPLVYFAAFKAHIGLYPMPDAITAFAADLEKYATAKGTVKIPLEDDVPLELLRRIVAFNAARIR
jgi:uncharacterized protein YdhG (YjbR/CyaY superfamily)